MVWVAVLSSFSPIWGFFSCLFFIPLADHFVLHNKHYYARSTRMFWSAQGDPKYLRFGKHGRPLRRDVSLPKSGSHHLHPLTTHLPSINFWKGDSLRDIFFCWTYLGNFSQTYSSRIGCKFSKWHVRDDMRNFSEKYFGCKSLKCVPQWTGWSGWLSSPLLPPGIWYKAISWL